MRKLEKRGQSALAVNNSANPVDKSHRYRVRFWYESAGGECLACDSGGLTLTQAETLLASYRRNEAGGTFIHAVIHKFDGKAWGPVNYGRYCTDKRYRADARVVVLPSQMDCTYSSEESEAA